MSNGLCVVSCNLQFFEYRRLLTNKGLLIILSYAHFTSLICTFYFRLSHNIITSKYMIMKSQVRTWEEPECDSEIFAIVA